MVHPHAFEINPTHCEEKVSDVLYGIFMVVHDACADSEYQALFSAEEKEPGVEATNLPNSTCKPEHKKK